MPTALNLPPEECLSRETLEPSKGRLNSSDDTRYFLQLSTFLAQLPELFLQVKTWDWLNSGLLDIYTNINRLWKLFMYSTVCWRWWHSLCSFLPTYKVQKWWIENKVHSVAEAEAQPGTLCTSSAMDSFTLWFAGVSNTWCTYPGKKFLCLFLIKD